MRVSYCMTKESASIRLELTAEHGPEWWSIHEVHVFAPDRAAREE
jgi:hypothetical protein